MTPSEELRALVERATEGPWISTVDHLEEDYPDSVIATRHGAPWDEQIARGQYGINHDFALIVFLVNNASAIADVLEKAGEALDVAHYAIRHPESDQAFALRAIEDASAALASMGGGEPGACDCQRVLAGHATNCAHCEDQDEQRRKEIRLYNEGYRAGHHDTVESQYTDIAEEDMDSFHSDVVASMGGGEE
jgi:hypothetical protein